MPAPLGFLTSRVKNVILFAYQLADMSSVVSLLRVCLPIRNGSSILMGGQK